MRAAPTPGNTGRILAVDVYRGMAMLLLLPDLQGGFSFYRMHQQFPDSRIWASLAAMFTHVQWSGCSAWDLIMPSFMFLAGVAMPLSITVRLNRGDTRRQVLVHIVIRCLALFLLSVIFYIPPHTRFDELWPLILLAVGLPIPESISRAGGLTAPAARTRVTFLWWSAILTASAFWIFARRYDLADYEFGHIFTQLSLATCFAYLFVGKPLKTQIFALGSLLFCYWLFFALFPLPAPGFNPSTVGVRPGDELFAGFFAHWNKNMNAAAWFDTWFLNVFPRTRIFRYNLGGLTTLNFVPMIATIGLGVIAGELMGSSRPRQRIRAILLAAGAVELIAGLVAGRWACPIVKMIWTPSWTLYSAGIASLTLGFLYHCCDIKGRSSWTAPFRAVGANSVLLYTLAYSYKWWFLVLPGRLSGVNMYVGPYAPLIESLFFGTIIVVIALALYRLRFFVRL